MPQPLSMQNAPAQIIGDRTDLGDLNTWMEKAFDHWCTMDAAHPANLIGELMPWAYQAMVEEQKAEIEVKNGA